jgi:uncharacterized protein DUF4189
MQTIRSIAHSTKAAIATLLIAGLPLWPAIAAEDSFILAQGSFEKLPPSIAPTPYSPDMPQTPQPRHDSSQLHSPPPSPSSPSSPSDAAWGAIAFTADGSYSSTWKMTSQPEAEAKVLRECARFGRGGCEVVTFSGQECVALSTFIGSYRRRGWKLSFTAAGNTYPDAQNAAMYRCNSDERTQGHCQPRTAACADGR